MKVVEMKDGDCERCAGCGYVTDGNGDPWKYWVNLPYQSALAIRMGLVKPIPCPECDGTGDQQEAQ